MFLLQHKITLFFYSTRTKIRHSLRVPLKNHKLPVKPMKIHFPFVLNGGKQKKLFIWIPDTKKILQGKINSFCNMICTLYVNICSVIYLQ